MKKDIYYLLNQVKTDLAVYEIKEIEQSEMQKRTEDILCKLHARGASAEVHDDRKIKAKKEFSLRKALRAAAIFVAAILSIGTVAYATTDGELFHYIYTFLSGGGIYETTEYSILGEESTVTAVMAEAEAAAVSEEGNTSVSGPLLFQDGRLYFTGDGGKTDITDKISEEEPYYIDVVDEMGNTHKFIIGGKAEGGCYGYQEILIDSEGKVRGGVGSYGAKVDASATWRQKADEEVMDWYIQQP